MKWKMPKIHKLYRRGFIAVTSVIFLALSTLTFSLVVLNAVIDYADSVEKKELRIQAKMNAESCLDHATLMTAKDYFISGKFDLPIFGCSSDFANDFKGNITINVKAQHVEVSSYKSRTLKYSDSHVEIISEI